jgi:hypothetical protein
MKTYILFILILFLANYSNLCSKNKMKDYYKMIAETEKKNAMLCLVEALQDTTIELPDCKPNKVFIGYKFKILKTYIDNINLADSIYSKDSIITLSFHISGYLDCWGCKPTVYDAFNDFQYPLHLNEPLLILVSYSSYDCHLRFSNKAIGFYTNKEPGKQLYNYLEKKYKKTYKKKK